MLKEWYEAEFIDTAFKAALTERLSGKDLKTLVAFEDAAKEALVLEYVKSNDGLQYVTDILAEFDKNLWDKDYTFDSSAIRECMGVDYSTANALLNNGWL